MKLLKYVFITILGILFVIPLSVYAKGYEIVSGDLDTVGSVVKIADEEFYVIGKKDETHVKLFAKYNLGVGKGFETPTYKQDESAIVSRVNDEYKGAVTFSNDTYWATSSNFIDESYNPKLIVDTDMGYDHNDFAAFVYNENSNIKQYIDKYIEYLNSNCVSVEGTLISREDLSSFGCRDICFDCAHVSLSCDTEYQWIFTPTYWTGYAVSAYFAGGSLGRLSYPIIVNISEYMVDNKYHGVGAPSYPTNENGGGVRPVIILDTSNETICPDDEQISEETSDDVTNNNNMEYENPPTGAFVSITLLVSLIIISVSMMIYSRKKSKIKKI